MPLTCDEISSTRLTRVPQFSLLLDNSRPAAVEVPDDLFLREFLEIDTADQVSTVIDFVRRWGPLTLPILTAADVGRVSVRRGVLGERLGPDLDVAVVPSDMSAHRAAVIEQLDLLQPISAELMRRGGVGADQGAPGISWTGYSFDAQRAVIDLFQAIFRSWIAIFNSIVSLYA